MATLTLLVNLIVLVWVLKTFKPHQGIAQVFAGNCQQAEKINTWIHLAINGTSTMLLSGSNYCMQILSAPTRKEIDEAHAKGKWLDIGVPSVRNLKNVARKKVVMWWLLGLSSIPLHLMYNSVFFSTIATNEYDIVFANEAFVRGGLQGTYDKIQFSGIEDVQAEAKTWERLEKVGCINAYATEFLSTRRSLVAVVVDKTMAANESVKRVVPYLFNYPANTPNTFNPYGWICDAADGDSRYGLTQTEMTSDYHCSLILPKVKAHVDRWHSNGWDIDYCLSERVEGKCSLNFSLSIIVVVMTCNVGKALIMFFIAFRVKDKPLITVGDAIDSFLKVNDPTSEGMCLITKGNIKAGENVQDFDDVSASYNTAYIREKTIKSNINWKAAPREYIPRIRRWSNAISRARWWWCMALFASCMITVSSLLAFGVFSANFNNGSTLSAKGLLDLGIGAVHPATLISGWILPSIGGSTVVASVLIANIPQPILSFIYLLFNGCFTGMLLGDEWSHFAHERKPLRVSDPKPGQRSTYFLQLPYRYAVPLIILSGVLHWSVSQSIFIAQVESFNKNGTIKDSAAISTCGYSPIAIIITLLIGACLASFVAVLGLRRYKPGIQLAGSCSAAISAACHGRSDIDTTAPLQWGATAEGGPQVGHCAFSDRAVEVPREGALYAGRQESD